MIRKSSQALPLLILWIKHTRKKRVLLLSLALVFLLATTAASFAADSFTDLPGTWVKPYVEKIVHYGSPVSGYADGSFRPDEPCTRGEFYSFLAHGIVSRDENDFAVENDSRHWAYKYWLILSDKYAEKNGDTLLPEGEHEIAAAGDSDYFDTKITRMEVVRVAGRVLNGVYDKPLVAAKAEFQDTTSISEEDQKYLNMLVGTGIIKGDVGNVFKPDDIITRGELVVVTGNIIDAYDFMNAPAVDRFARVFGYPLKGYEKGNFDYSAPCTRGEFFQLLAYSVLSPEENFYERYDNQGWAAGYYNRLDDYYFFKMLTKHDTETHLDDRQKNNSKAFLEATISKAEAAEYAGKIAHALLDKALPSAKAGFDDTNGLSGEQQQYINLMTSEGIFSASQNLFNPDEHMTRGDAVTVMVRLLDKYGLADPYRRVARTDNLPANYKEFPYIVAEVPNEVYEMPYIKDPLGGFVNPVDIFGKYRYNAGYTAEQIKGLLELANVDYRSINTDEIRTTLKRFADEEGSRVDDYIQNLISQQVVSECTVTPEPSIMYDDGMWGRMRAKVTLNVKECVGSSVKNLFFGDYVAQINISYPKGTYTFYVDHGLSPFAVGSKTLYTFAQSMDNMTIGRVKKIEGMEYVFQ